MAANNTPDILGTPGTLETFLKTKGKLISISGERVVMEIESNFMGLFDDIKKDLGLDSDLESVENKGDVCIVTFSVKVSPAEEIMRMLSKYEEGLSPSKGFED